MFMFGIMVVGIMVVKNRYAHGYGIFYDVVSKNIFLNTLDNSKMVNFTESEQ